MFKKPWLRDLLAFRTIYLVLLISNCLLLHIISRDKMWVENNYSNGIYPIMASYYRMLLGWIPFSVGDIIYGIIILYSLFKIFKIFKRKNSLSPKGMFYRLITVLGWVYLLFNLFWGLNYNRLGIARQLGMEMDEYSKPELIGINYLLLAKVNEHKLATLDSTFIYRKKRDLFNEAIHTFGEAAKTYPYLKYIHPSVKPSIYSYLGNYLGFGGYYNPLSAEAQVNTTVPKFLQPFTTCHEIAHQLGYAKEMEANFVAFLATSHSANATFRYSVYFDLFAYANSNLFLLDSLEARKIRKHLNAYVLEDIEELRAFAKKYRNDFEPIIKWGYDLFLLSNQQPQGILSYDEVTSFIIAYYKKFGHI